MEIIRLKILFSGKCKSTCILEKIYEAYCKLELFFLAISSGRLMCRTNRIRTNKISYIFAVIIYSSI